MSPDLILTLDGVNDIVSTTKTGQPGVSISAKYLMAASHSPVANAVSSLALRSQFVNSLVKIQDRRKEKSAILEKGLTELTIEQYLQGLRTISLISKAVGAQHIAVLQPYIYLRKSGPESEKERFSVKRFHYRHAFISESMKAINDRMSEFQYSSGHYCVNGTKAFDKSQKDCFINEVHLNLEGYQLLANYIIEQVTMRGFSPGIEKENPPCSQCWPEKPVSQTPVPQLIFSP